MKFLKVIGHIVVVLGALFLMAGLPILTHFDLFASEETDAVSGASIPLPDQPSGDFLVLINRSGHEDTLEDWRTFFTGEDLPVIFEDIQCLVAEGDASGQQLAERFRLQLPENQMTLRTENATLLVSKAEAGCIDIAIFSKEMADALKLSPDPDKVTILEVTGGED